MNTANVVGRLGADPELKKIGESVVCNFSVATTETYQGQDGQTKKVTNWLRIQAWGKRGEVCSKYLQKGSLVAIQGPVVTRSVEKNGQKQYYTSIKANNVEFLSGTQQPQSEQQQQQAQQPQQNVQNEVPSFDEYEPLPF